jgi:hypothetical protein
MFRYGGPIKEGVMSGIREPKKHGGSMGNLVGSPAYPKTNGREHHALVSGTIAAGTGLRMAAPWIARQAARYLPKIKRIFGRTTPGGPQKFAGPDRTWNIGKGFSSKPGYIKDVGAATFQPNYLGRDPLVQGLGWAGKSLFNPTTGGWAAKGLRMAASPSSILIGGLWYANGKWFNKDGSPANEKSIAQAKASTGGPPGGGDPGMQGTGEWFAEQAEKEANIAKQKEWNNRIKKYRDIMDIKGMNKEAAYKSLVDASKLIQESGDFKGDIRSGKLINQVIQAASKQFDKPAKTSDAINTLILQNELKKDLSAETDALDKEYKRSAIAINEKKLAGATLNEDIGAFRTKHQKNPSGAKLEGILLDKDIPVVDVADTVQVDKHIKKGGDEVSFMESIVEANVKEGKSVTPGVYVVKDKIIVIDENGNVKKKR